MVRAIVTVMLAIVWAFLHVAMLMVMRGVEGFMFIEITLELKEVRVLFVMILWSMVFVVINVLGGNLIAVIILVVHRLFMHVMMYGLVMDVVSRLIVVFMDRFVMYMNRLVVHMVYNFMHVMHGLLVIMYCLVDMRM